MKLDVESLLIAVVAVVVLVGCFAPDASTGRTYKEYGPSETEAAQLRRDYGPARPKGY